MLAALPLEALLPAVLPPNALLPAALPPAEALLPEVEAGLSSSPDDASESWASLSLVGFPLASEVDFDETFITVSLESYFTILLEFEKSI